MADQIKLRRGTAAQWSSSNPILAVGELGFEVDTNKFKLGNGSDNWSSLSYFVDENGVDLSLYAPLNSPTFTGSVEIEGTLNISGSVTTISSQDLVLEDSLIYLAEGNVGNIVDIGIVGSFTAASAYQHAGFVRDATDGVWKLFESVEDEPTETINFSQAVYSALKAGSLEVTSATIGDVSNTELQYLNNASANIQDQINSKVDKLYVVDTKSTSYTLLSGDDLKLLQFNGTLTVTVPTDTTLNFPIGTEINLLNIGTGVVTIAGATTPGTAATVNGTPGLKLRAQWSAASLIKRAANTWVLVGDLTS